MENNKPKEIISVPCLLWDRGYLSDGGRRIWVSTNELVDSQIALINRYGDNKTFGYFFFSPEKIKIQDIKDVPEIEPEFKGGKSPSQRLRNTFYILWEQNGAKGDFEDYYKYQIEKIITTIKEKLI